MAVYKRGKYYSYEFVFAGQRIRESTRSRSKQVAEDAERNRRRELEQGLHGIKKRVQPKVFSVAAREWVELKRATLAPRSLDIEETNIGHLTPTFGKLLIIDIEPEDISRYQQARVRNGASNKTVNLELGTLRAILREHFLEFKIRQWVEIQRKDLFVKVYSDGKLFGTLKVSQGSVDWSPAGSKREKPHVIYWHEFDEFARTKRRGVRALSATAR